MTPKRWFTTGVLLCALMLAGAQLGYAQTAVTITDGPKVESVRDTSAVIVWTTNVPASSVVRYSTDMNDLNQTAQEAWGGKEAPGGGRIHRVELKNLKPGTPYAVKVESAQAQGTGTAASARMSFATLTTEVASQQDTANSAIKITDGPKVEFVNDTTAVIAWTTDRPSSSLVRFGTDRNNLNQTAEDDRRGRNNMGMGSRDGERGRRDPRNHRVEIKNLQPNTAYYFVVESGHPRRNDVAAKSSVTELKTLTAEAAAEAYRQKQGTSTLKIQAGPVPQSLTDTTASLWLMTSEDAPVVVRYGTDRNNLNLTAQSPTGKQHSVKLTNLQPSATYFFEVSAADGKVKEMGQFQTENANFAAQPRRVFLTKGPVIEYITKSNAIVAWSTNVRSSSIVRYGTDPNNLNMTAQAPWGQETHRVEVKNLKPETKYYFVVESAQAEGSGTLAKSNSAAFTTVATGQQALRNPQPQ